MAAQYRPAARPRGRRVIILKIGAWVKGIAARPAVVKALAAVDDVRTKTTQFDKAGEAQKDRLFGRGDYNAPRRAFRRGNG